MGFWRERGGLSAAFSKPSCQLGSADFRTRRLRPWNSKPPISQDICHGLPRDRVQSWMVQINVVHNFRQGRQLQIPERAEIEDTKTWKKVLIEDR